MRPEKTELVKQIVTYADAITAFSFVQSTAFGFALAGHEFRKAILDIPCHGAWGIPFAYLIYIGIVMKLRRKYEEALDASENEKKPEEEKPGEAKKREKESDEYNLAQFLWRGRIFIIILAIVLSVIAIAFTFHGANAQNDKSGVNAGGIPTKATTQTCKAAGDLGLYNTDRLRTMSRRELIARRTFAIACLVQVPDQRQDFEGVLEPINEEISNRYAVIISEEQECCRK